MFILEFLGQDRLKSPDALKRVAISRLRSLPLMGYTFVPLMGLLPLMGHIATDGLVATDGLFCH